MKQILHFSIACIDFSKGTKWFLSININHNQEDNMRASIDVNDRLVLGQETIQVQDAADVVVAGAGIAGWAAAVSAARLGVRVILVEQDAFPGGAATAGMMAMWAAAGVRLSGMATEFLDRMVKAGGSLRGSVMPLDPELFKDVSIQMLDEANGGGDVRADRA